MSGPDPGSFGRVDAAAVPAVAAFERADPALASGAPLDGSPERGSSFVSVAGGTGAALAGNHHVAHTQLVQGIVDAFLPVAAVGGGGSRFASGATDDSFDGRCELRCVGRVALPSAS